MPRITDFTFKTVSLFNGQYYENRWPENALVAYGRGKNSAGDPDDEETAVAIKFDSPREYWGKAINIASLSFRFYGYIVADKTSTNTFPLTLTQSYIEHGKEITEFTNFNISDIAPYSTAFSLKFNEFIARRTGSGTITLVTKLINDGFILSFNPSKNEIPNWSQSVVVISEFEKHTQYTYVDITFGGTRAVYNDRVNRRKH